MSGLRMPERLKREETGRYELFVCLNRNEHENALVQEYGIPGEKIICWDILDVEESPSEIEMERLEQLVRKLTGSISGIIIRTCFHLQCG